MSDYNEMESASITRTFQRVNEIGETLSILSDASYECEEPMVLVLPTQHGAALLAVNAILAACGQAQQLAQMGAPVSAARVAQAASVAIAMFEEIVRTDNV